MKELANVNRLRQRDLLRPFPRVWLQDSTNLSLPDHLAEAFPGPGNGRKKTSASLKIQAVYDLLSDSFHQFRVSGFTRTDQMAAADILQVARKGDLVIRDLGYSAMAVFQKMLDSGIHFLSRLSARVSVYDPVTLKKLDLVELLRKNGSLDCQVLVGAHAKMPIRLVALRVPEEVANQRRRKAKQNKDGRYKPSAKFLQLLGWQLFITSVPDTVWSAKNVQDVYAMRWRIEIIFKSWKSHFNMTALPKASADTLEAFLWAELFAICLFQPMFGALDLHYSYSNRPLSLLKMAQFFPLLLASVFIKVNDPMLISALLATHFFLEKRNKKKPLLLNPVSLCSAPFG